MTAALLGVGAFAVGVLPLSFTFSSAYVTQISHPFESPFLLRNNNGIPVKLRHRLATWHSVRRHHSGVSWYKLEASVNLVLITAHRGVETIAMTNASRIFPTTTVALSLVGGFSFMLLVEPIIHRVSSHPGLTAHHTPLPTSADDLSSASHAQSAHVEFDVELGELEQAEGVAMDGPSPNQRTRNQDVPPTPAAVAYPLTLGLVVHALSDGFALGSAAISPVDDSLTLVVFLALMVHKGMCCIYLPVTGADMCPTQAPTVLALTTSLLAMSLSRSECRKHIAVFSASTPIGAFISYALLSFARINSEGNWTGVAMLISVSL